MWLLVLLAAAPDFICPEGTLAKERTTPEAKERWCEKPDGTRHGPRHAWTADGARWFAGSYAAGGRSGAWMFWYPNGKVRNEGTYVADARVGVSKHFYEDGALALEGTCKAGLEEGAWTSYWPSGAKDLVATFAAGKLTGVKHHSRSGAPVDEAAWLAGKARGAKPGTPAWDAARKRYAAEVVFVECRN
jgi:antitoxin component YwqK of YwqJK toxin-antitoxin module